MDRRLAEWERLIPAQYREAVDVVVAQYMVIGTVEGRGWQWTDAEAACTDMIRQLHGRRRARQAEGYNRKGHKPHEDDDIVQHQPAIMGCHTPANA